MQWNLFLSSTVRDFKSYRRVVQEWCRVKANTACQLSEDGWTGGYDDTLAKCKRRVIGADAFILLGGHWYGWVPNGCDRSITHLEFDQAMNKWGQDKYPPVAVMLPKPGSRADRFLKATAARVLAEEERSRPAFDRTEHDRQIDAFRAVLSSSARTVTYFKDGPDLAGWAISSCLTWQGGGRTFLGASQAAAPAKASFLPPPATDEQLGLLGRESHLRALKTALAAVAGRPEAPALAFIAHGGDDAGQRVFLQALPGLAFKGLGPRQRVTRLNAAQGDPALLPAWIAKTLSLPDGGGIRTPEGLAECAARELRSRPLYFMLDRIGDLDGGAAAFREQFWLPLYCKLQELKAAQAFSHRLVAVVADYGDSEKSWQDAATEPKPRQGPPDYTRLLRLPRLEDFELDDLLVWFEDQDVPDQPGGRRMDLAQRALKNSKGVADGSPLRVFDFLRGERLWPEGDNP